MSNFRRDFLYLIGGIVAILVAWAIAFSFRLDVSPKIAELRAKIPEGRLEMAKEAFLHTPFVVDSILSEGVNFLFYQRPVGKLSGAAEQTWRIYSPGESDLVINFSYIKSAKSTPTVWLYDERGKLIQNGMQTSSEGGKKSVFFIKAPTPGVYKVKLRFLYENVSEIRVSGKNIKNILSYNDYLKYNTKKIELVIVNNELQKLNSLVKKAKEIWSKAQPIDVLWPQYLGVEGKVFGILRTKSGADIRVAIGLSGRSGVHLPTDDSPLPSLDIKVLSGPLPYGLRTFKLYTAHAKGISGIVHASNLEDYGILVPRQDNVEVILNGKSVGKMTLLEVMDDAFFEAAQRIEGPVWGYDPDDAVGKFYNNTLRVKNFSTSKLKKDEYAPDLASPEFAQKINTQQMLFVQSYGLTYAAYHGLGQADLRYHWNFLSETYDPIIKDLDAGVLAPAPGTFLTSWVYLNPFAPLWRPNAVSVGSYYLRHSATGRELYDKNGGGLFLWHTPPSTLNILEDKKNLKTIGELNHMWASHWSRHKIQNRLNNLMLSLGRDFGERPIIITQDFLPESLWDPSQHKPSRSIVRVGKLISDLTKSQVNPSVDSLSSLDWRNVVIQKIYGELKMSDNDLAPSQLLTFLYRTEEPDSSNIILVERGPKDTAIKVKLKSKDGVQYEPKAIHFYDGGKKTANIKEVELSDIKQNEAIRLYWFKIDRNDDYQYIFPSIIGNGLAITPREIIIGPKYNEKANLVRSKITTFFDISGSSLRLKKNHSPIDIALVIPYGSSLFIDTDTTIKFAKTGCLKVYGDLKIKDEASLNLIPALNEAGWSGIHFFNGNDRIFQNVHVEGVGYGEYGVTCGKSKFSGGVSFYNTKVAIRNIEIKNSHIEDALHILNSEVEINRLLIENTQSDCLDSDFSVLLVSNSKFISCGGDGLDISGSLSFLKNSESSKNSDKAISAGENSRVYIQGTKLNESDIGIASKDGSLVTISKSIIEANRVGAAVYSKKPFFPEAKFEYDDSVTFSSNSRKISAGSNQTSEVNISKKK